MKFLVKISIVNSLPLTPVTNNPNGIGYLTQIFFLLGRASANQKFIAAIEKDTNLRVKWKATLAMTDIFWKKGIKKYFPGLTKRQKWMSHLQNMKVGDLEYIAEDSIERSILAISQSH